jgi:hypothetical protein
MGEEGVKHLTEATAGDDDSVQAVEFTGRKSIIVSVKLNALSMVRGNRVSVYPLVGGAAD